MLPLPLFLRASQLSIQFGSLVALKDVDLSIQPGEVVGLAGRSGAGKSILIKVLSGLMTPDSGTLHFAGERLQWPFVAQELGIGIVYQEPALADRFDVTSNIFLGHEIKRKIGRWSINLPDQGKMEREAQRLLDSLDVRVPSLDQPVGTLSSEQRQLIAIAQVMSRPYQFIIVDDPSQLLSYPYQQKVLDLIRSWQRQGTAVLFSSNNLDHLFAVADRVVVLRQGQVVGNFRTDETNREDIVSTLIGTSDRQERTPVIWALDSYYRARNQAETLRHNQTLLQRDLAVQDTINKHLLDQLSEQVEALDSANLALQDAQRRLLTEREEERKHLARELHDQLIQDLLSVNYQLEDVESYANGDGQLADDVADIRGTIRFLVEELRRICGDLRPPTIDSLGLDAALKSFTYAWSERTGIEVDLKIDAQFGRLPEEIELSIFRIVQESLNNVWKHANATAVSVTLKHTSPRMLLVSIADDGHGMKKDLDLATLSREGHYGLLGISERVALMGGRLNFRNRKKGGLLIQVEIPHPRVVKEK